MGASDLPYLYQPTTHTSAYPSQDFNPKAVTHAHYARLSQASSAPTSPKKEGPLINFNEHPDSYVVYSGAQKEHKALPKNTKKVIVTTRWVQFALRVLQEIVALGLLACGICLKGTSGAETYLIRVPVSPHLASPRV